MLQVAKEVAKDPNKEVVNIDVVIDGGTISYDGHIYERAIIDFSQLLDQPLWDNEGFSALTKSFRTIDDVIELQTHRQRTCRYHPEMSVKLLSALIDVTNKYLWSEAKAVEGYRFYFDASSCLSLVNTRLTRDERIDGIISTILRHFVGHIPLFKFKVKKTKKTA